MNRELDFYDRAEELWRLTEVAAEQYQAVFIQSAERVQSSRASLERTEEAVARSMEILMVSSEILARKIRSF